EPYSGSGTVGLWEAATGRLLRSLPAERLLLRPLAFSPDGKHLFVGTSSAIRRCEVATGRESGRYPLDEADKKGNGHLWFMHLTGDGRTLWGGPHSEPGGGYGVGLRAPGPAGATLTLYAWDVATGKRLPAPTFPVRGPGTDWAGYCRFSPDGKLLAIPGGIL